MLVRASAPSGLRNALSSGCTCEVVAAGSSVLIWFGRVFGVECDTCGLFMGLWAGDLVPTALAAGRPGASGWADRHRRGERRRRP